MTRFVVLIEVLVWVFLLIALVYFLFKRIRDKKEERFEDRSN